MNAGMNTVATGRVNPARRIPVNKKPGRSFFSPARKTVQDRKNTDSENGRNIKMRLGIEASKIKRLLSILNNVDSHASEVIKINPLSVLMPMLPRNVNFQRRGKSGKKATMPVA